MSDPKAPSEFDGIEDVSSSDRMPRLDRKHGEYVLEILETKKFTSRKNERWYFNTFKVVSSLGPTAYPVGSLVSSNFNKAWDTCLKSVKGLTAAVMGVSEDSVKAADCDELYAPDMPARGRRITAIVYEREKVKTPGTFFNAILFQPLTAASTDATPVPETGETSST